MVSSPATSVQQQKKKGGPHGIYGQTCTRRNNCPATAIAIL